MGFGHVVPAALPTIARARQRPGWLIPITVARSLQELRAVILLMMEAARRREGF